MTRPLQLGVTGGAVFDAGHFNRFLLLRTWNENLPRVAFCLTNPSKAGAVLDDPTSIKVQTYARLWNFGGVVLCNAFSWCTTNPKELYNRDETEETIADNFQAIKEAAELCPLFVCGWGRNGAIAGRSTRIREALKGVDIHALRLLRDGEPEHPLYLPSKLRPVSIRTGEYFRGKS